MNVLELREDRLDTVAPEESALRPGVEEGVAMQPSAEAIAPISGLYQWKRLPIGPPSPVTREELRVDVDGWYPQMVVSGVAFAGLTSKVSWIARVQRVQTPTGIAWQGPVFYKDGLASLMPYAQVSVRPHLLGVQATFSGGGPTLQRLYLPKSKSFQPVELEFDSVSAITAVTSVQTNAHPDRPSDLPAENLTIEEVFRRTGFGVTKSNGDSVVPIAGSGADQKWSNAEMHDAMQIHWSRFANKPQWSLWTLFADRHEMGTGLGGIMFDSIGPNHRQGTALFLNSFISQAPTSDPVPTAWVRRMVFWTAVHEMGHAFNLAHSWQKHLGTPWVPLTSDTEARSFMNYPYNVSGGVPTFFKSFRYRFSDQELLFLRHAPERFVQMGNAAWFDHHAFEQADTSEEASFRLTLRVNRDKPVFEYLEPVVVELKLTNVSDEPQLIEESILKTLEDFTIIVVKDGRDARQHLPMARYCWRGKKTVLQPDESLYESIFISAGTAGWNVADPGHYTIQACMQRQEADVVSNALRIKVLLPHNRDEELIGQDYFSDEVGRVMAFDGSRYLESANDTLRTVAARSKDCKAAIHANVALGMAMLRPFKLIQFADENGHGNGSAKTPRGRIDVRPADESGLEFLNAALGESAEASSAAAESLGHIDYRYYAEQVADACLQSGDRHEAAQTQRKLVDTMSARKVKGRKVAEPVMEEMKKRLDEIEATDADGKTAGRGRHSRRS